MGWLHNKRMISTQWTFSPNLTDSIFHEQIDIVCFRARDDCQLLLPCDTFHYHLPTEWESSFLNLKFKLRASFAARRVPSLNASDKMNYYPISLEFIIHTLFCASKTLGARDMSYIFSDCVTRIPLRKYILPLKCSRRLMWCLLLNPNINSCE